MFFGRVCDNGITQEDEFFVQKNFSSKNVVYFNNATIYFFSSEIRDFRKNGQNGIILVGNAHRRYSKEVECYSIEDVNKNFWGDYIAFLVCNNFLKEIFRGLCSVQSVYYKVIEGDLIFGSHISYFGNIKKGSLNLNYLSRFLLYGQSLSTETAFLEISELQVGCSLSALGDYPTKMVWNPTDYTNVTRKKCGDTQLAETLDYVIKKQCKDVKSTILDYSGGLDSTALLYTMKQNLPDKGALKALNCYHSSVASSNESEFAKRVCNNLDVPFLGYDYKKNKLPFTPVQFAQEFIDKPDPALIRYMVDSDIAEMVKKMGYHHLFNGEGGDHLFMCPPAIESLSDLIIDKKFNLLRQKTGEIATIFRKNIFELLSITKKNLFSYILRNGYQNILELTQFRASWHTEDLVNLQKNFSFHPFYYQKHDRILPGKFYQIDNIYIALSVITSDIRNQLIKCYYPILTQPMIELALSFPAYELYQNGYDRFPFRNSISKAFSTQDVWRKDKGESTGTALLGMKKYIKYVTSLLMDGYFAKEKLIDRELLYQNIKQLTNGYADNQWAIIHLVACELFLEHWQK